MSAPEQLPRVFILYEAELPEYLQAVPGYEQHEARLLALARALSANSLWPDAFVGTLVVRPAPSPVLGVIGHFDSVSEARLKGLRWQLAHVLPRWRYLSYAQVQEACERLAAHLLERFGRDELRRFRFTALPRGGFIVLGMLAYLLDLRQAQLEAPHPADVPLVVVDDCAISGLRFGRFLESCPDRQLIFAHLFSHPELRQAIEAREPSVMSCVSAHDTHDYAPEAFGEDYPAWKERWWKRSDPRAYWVGQPEHICFPWNEPDVAIWNSATEREERGWQLAPPELCLKNRPAPGQELLEVQVQPEGKGPLKPSEHVLFGELNGRVILCSIEAEESFALSEVASAMWQAIVEHGEIDDAVATLVKDYEVDEAILQADLMAFVEELLARGLLERSIS